MALITRRIDGPQDFNEQSEGLSYLDTRPLSSIIYETLTSRFSALLIFLSAIISFSFPALIHVLLPISLLLAAFVLTRPVSMPLRLPKDSPYKDYNFPVPDPKRTGMEVAGKAAGDWLIGWDTVTNKQCWLSSNDMTMHAVLPGSTGSGKTQFIYSVLCNSLAMGSGFILVDGKASNNLYFSVLSMARRWGREADVRVINLMVSSGDRRTNRWNPFTTVNAEGLTELLLILFLPESSSSGGNSEHFRSRAEALIRGMAPIFIWTRDRLNIPVTPLTLRVMFSDINNLRKLYMEKTFTYCNFETGEILSSVLGNDFDDSLLGPVRSYVIETGGFSEGKSVDDQDKVREQHSYVVGGFGKTFTQMTSTLGHIFECQMSDVDFRDVLYNRRILVVMLPSLENHPDTNAALGKMVITALRYAAAEALGASIEGNYEDLVVHRPSSSDTPSPIILDEVGQYATRGIDALMALGRELNLSLFISFQEVGTLYATLGKDRTIPLLGNPKLKIFENIEDATFTKEWVESTGGEMPVTVRPGYDGDINGIFQAQPRADIRTVKRISWSDIQKLRPGQAIILFRGKRIYTTLFYAGIKPSGVARVFPGLHHALGMDSSDNEEERNDSEKLVLNEVYKKLSLLLKKGDFNNSNEIGEFILDIELPEENDKTDPFAKLFRPGLSYSDYEVSKDIKLPDELEKMAAELIAYEISYGNYEEDIKDKIRTALSYLS